MISNKEWTICISITCVTFIIASIIYYILKIQNKQFEALTMNAKGLPLPSEISENLKKQNDELDNELQIDKYRDQYEDIIINYEELYYLDTIKRMINTENNKERRKLLAENAINVKSLDDTAKFIYSH
tara:strand:- start:1291 stop:1674 length:384 start_codon:yes stop_codon:yes gene_type:complete